MAITSKERCWIILAIILITSVCLPGRCESNSSEVYDDDADSEVTCQPTDADTCFTEVNNNLLCHVVSPNKNLNCTRRGPADMCLSLEDALNCTSDIIDYECKEEKGKLSFDNWLKGFYGVHARLCQQKNYELLGKFLKKNNCWNVRAFVRCVENTANLTHIGDLLTTNLTQHECNLIQMTVSICNDKAERGRAKCRGQANAVKEAIAAFFSSSECGKMEPLCNVFQPQESKAPIQTGSSSNSGVAVFLTLLVTIVLLAVTAFVLIRANVISVNTKFRRSRGAENDENEGTVETGEDYGRFF